MLNGRQDTQNEFHADAVVIGGGLAGLAAAMHMTRAGLKVVCLEPRESFSENCR